MKQTIALIASLGLNLILGAMVVYQLTQSPDEPTAPVAAPVTLSGNRVESVSPAPPVRRAAAPRETAVAAPAKWEELLRQGGVAEDLIARLIVAEVGQKMTERRQEIGRQSQRGDLTDAQRSKAYQDLMEEETALLQAALGAARYHKYDMDRTLRQFDSYDLKVTDDARERLYQAVKANQEAIQQLSRAHTAGEVDAVDFQKSQTELARQFDQTLRQALGESGYVEFKQAGNYSVGQLRRDLKAAGNFTDAQVSRAVAAQQAFDDRVQQYQATAKEGKQDMNFVQQARQTLEADLQLALGPAGYADYQRSQDYTYKRLNQFAPAWQLAAADVNSIYSALQAYRQKTADYQKEARNLAASGQPVDWSDLQKNLQAYGQEVAQQLRQQLGDERYKRMQTVGIFPFPINTP